jgi:hypothetical protein
VEPYIHSHIRLHGVVLNCLIMHSDIFFTFYVNAFSDDMSVDCVLFPLFRFVPSAVQYVQHLE